jgi:hypothetical protein
MIAVIAIYFMRRQIRRDREWWYSGYLVYLRGYTTLCGSLFFNSISPYQVQRIYATVDVIFLLKTMSEEDVRKEEKKRNLL